LDYTDYKVLYDDNKVIVEGVKDFDPVHIFECGQCFRWLRQEDGSYTGIARAKVANIKYCNGMLEITNSTREDFENVWFDYLDLGRDYSEIKHELAKDDVMRKAIAFGHGIRILRQELWETLISFIISANNRIPMIMKVVAALSSVYGDEITFQDDSYYTFPQVEKIARSSVEQLEFCRGGFRCKYIIGTANMVSNGEVDLPGISQMSTDGARSELTKFPGVGNKVADCTLLYSGTKYDVFPTDVWVKRVMEELYFKREASFKEIQEFARDYFGELAGFAQQYLFYYARENRIGVK
jgi:N-glycosylase/DNA lyase